MLPQAIALPLFTNSCHTHRWRSLHSSSRIKAKDFRAVRREAFSVISRKLEPEKERIRHSTMHKQTAEHVARERSHERESPAKKQTKKARKKGKKRKETESLAVERRIGPITIDWDLTVRVKLKGGTHSGTWEREREKRKAVFSFPSLIKGGPDQAGAERASPKGLRRKFNLDRCQIRTGESVTVRSVVMWQQACATILPVVLVRVRIMF